MNIHSRRSFLQSSALWMAARGLSAAEAPSPLVCGQIGTGHPHAAGKLSAMRAQGGAWRVAGVVEPDPTRREALAGTAAYAGVPWMAEAELLGVPGLVMVAVETGFDDGTPAALRAIRAGKHVHLDKPGGADHVAFKAMRLDAETRGLIVQMGYMLRYNPAFELLFRAVREGWLGEILEVDASMGKLANEAGRVQIAAQPGGAMFEIGCHLIDIIVSLLGPPAEVRAFNTPTRADGVPDNQLAVLVYPRATANVRANFADPFGGPRRRFNVTGTLGTLEIAPLESGRVKLSLSRPAGGYAAGQHEISLPRPGGRYDLEFVDLAKVVRGEKTLDWPAAHDIAVHATSLRAAGL